MIAWTKARCGYEQDKSGDKCHAMDIQLTLEQHECKLCGPNYKGFFSMNKYSVVNVITFLYDFNNIFFSLAYFIGGMKYIVHRT